MKLADAFSYPIRGGGWIILVLGAVLAVILDFLQTAPLMGLLVGIFAAGYFGSFYLSIINATMIDRDQVPDWPSFGSFLDDILSPLLRLAGLIILSFLPMIFVFFLGGEPDWALALFLSALIWGCLYFPMATMATLAFGGIGAASPHIVLPAIWRSMPGYLLVVVVLVVAFGLFALVEELASSVRYVGSFVAALVGLYGMMFQGRLIGLLYRDKRHLLGWD